MSIESLPDGWVVWSEEREKVVFAYRPDVFDGGDYPAPCLPTIYLTCGQRDRRPGGRRVGADWFVTLYLEPDVDGPADRYPDREAAVDGAVSVASEFANGDVDYRDLYQIPREEYLDRLDELTGSGDAEPHA